MLFRTASLIRQGARLATLLALAACSQDNGVSAGGGDSLTVTGSSTLAPLVAEIARLYEAGHAGARIEVQSGGSSRGIADVRRGTADIGMVSRSLLPSEIDLTATMIARDGVSIIVNRQNSVRALTDEQIVAIYRGELTNWRAVGGDDADIVVVTKADGRATLEVFLAYFDLDPRDIRADVVIGENAQGIKTVAGNVRAIAYVSIGSAEAEIAAGEPIKVLPVHGVEASTAAVADGSFPLSRPLNLVTRGAPAGFAAAFIEFARGSEAREAIADQYFVPLAR